MNVDETVVRECVCLRLRDRLAAGQARWIEAHRAPRRVGVPPRALAAEPAFGGR